MKLHSVVNLITNSSTEIFETATQASIDELKKAINILLEQGESKLRFDDLFEAEIIWSDSTLDDWEEEEDKEKFHNSIDEFVYHANEYNEFPYTSTLKVVSKNTGTPVLWKNLIDGVYSLTAVANY